MIERRKMMKKLLSGCLIIAVFCFVASPAMAVDVQPPSWRGVPDSTVQEWNFLSDTNPLTPDGELYDNSYGEPMCTVNLFEGGYWLETVSSAPSLFGWWVGVDSIDVDVPNASIANPLKWVQVQVTYGLFGPHYAPDSVYATAASDVFYGSLVETVPGAGTSRTNVYIIEVVPNPEFETITLDWYAGPGGIVDQVVVDTICIPEPATMGLLGLGGLVLLLRRRRS